MNCNDNWVVCGIGVEYPRVNIADLKAKVSKCMFECVVSLSASLLQYIQGLLKVLDSVFATVIPGWILHENIFIIPQLAIQVGTVCSGNASALQLRKN